MSISGQSLEHSSQPLAGTVALKQLHRLRVLVVDDNADAGDSLALLLRLWGHDVYVCRNGPDALLAAQFFRPDTALMELVLPAMDGCKLARYLREQQNAPPIMLIALTGLGDPTSRRLAQEAGFALHLLKPVELSELQALLETLAERIWQARYEPMGSAHSPPVAGG